MDHPVIDEFPSLYHAGVKGMKWGVRKDKYKSASRGERKQIRQKQEKKILAARDRVDKNTNVLNRLNNRATYGKLGGRAAISALNPNSSASDIDLATQITRGEQITQGIILGTSGALFVASGVASALQNR